MEMRKNKMKLNKNELIECNMKIIGKFRKKNLFKFLMKKRMNQLNESKINNNLNDKIQYKINIENLNLTKEIYELNFCNEELIKKNLILLLNVNNNINEIKYGIYMLKLFSNIQNDFNEDLINNLNICKILFEILNNNLNHFDLINEIIYIFIIFVSSLNNNKILNENLISKNFIELFTKIFYFNDCILNKNLIKLYSNFIIDNKDLIENNYKLFEFLIIIIKYIENKKNYKKTYFHFLLCVSNFTKNFNVQNKIFEILCKGYKFQFNNKKYINKILQQINYIFNEFNSENLFEILNNLKIVKFILNKNLTSYYEIKLINYYFSYIIDNNKILTINFQQIFNYFSQFIININNITFDNRIIIIESIIFFSNLTLFLNEEEYFNLYKNNLKCFKNIFSYFSEKFYYYKDLLDEILILIENLIEYQNCEFIDLIFKNGNFIKKFYYLILENKNKEKEYVINLNNVLEKIILNVLNIFKYKNEQLLKEYLYEIENIGLQDILNFNLEFLI